MSAGRTILFALAAAVALSGCKPDRANPAHLTVAGPRAGLERFLAIEEAGEPPLTVSALESLPEGRSQARLDVPAEYDGDDLARLTKAALDAGLSYQLERVTRQ